MAKIGYEDILIASCLRNKQTVIFALAEGWQPNDFERVEARVIFDIIKHYAEKNLSKDSSILGFRGCGIVLERKANASNPTITQADLPKYTDYLRKLKKVDTDSEEFVVDEWRDRLKARRFELALEKTYEEFQDNKDFDSASNQLLNYTLSLHRSKNKATDLESDFSRRTEKIQKAVAKGKLFTVRTGWPTIDSKLGGVQTAETMLIAGYPSSGKTYALYTIAINAFNLGYNVYVIATENKDEQVWARLESIYYGLDYRRLKYRDSSIDYKAIAKQEKKANRLLIDRFLPRKATIHDVFKQIKMYEIQDKFKPHLIVWDSIDLMKVGEAHKGRYDLDLENSYFEVKEYLEANDISCVSTSQVKMGDFKKKKKFTDTTDWMLGMGDLGQATQAKAAYADIIMTLNTNEQLDDAKEVVGYLCKMRDAAERPFDVTFKRELNTGRLLESNAKRIIKAHKEKQKEEDEDDD